MKHRSQSKLEHNLEDTLYRPTESVLYASLFNLYHKYTFLLIQFYKNIKKESVQFYSLLINLKILGPLLQLPVKDGFS